MLLKSDLIARIAADANITKSAAAVALNAALDEITKALSIGDQVKLVGFGSFEVRTRAGHAVADPRTKEKIFLTPQSTVGFRPSKHLKLCVNQERCFHKAAE